MLNSYITYARNVLFLGAGASQPLGKMLMTEFIEHLKTKQYISQYSLFHDIVNKHADLEYLLQELDDISTKNYLNYEFFRGGTPPPPPNLGLPMRTESSFQELAHVASTLRTLVQDEVFKHYRGFDDDGKIQPLFQPLFEKLSRDVSEQLVVFTTNYDPAVEIYCEISQQFDYTDGFAHDPQAREYVCSRANFEQFESRSDRRALFLFKLHGSTTWMKKGKRVIRAPAVQAQGDLQHRNMMIYPAMLKVATEDPYFTCYCYLQECLSHAQNCLVVGYSFRDYDALTRMRAASIANPNLVIQVLDPNAEALVESLDELEISATAIPRTLATESPLPDIVVPRG